MTATFTLIKTDEDFSRYFLNEIWQEAAKDICRRHKISFTQLKRIETGEHIVFLIDASFVIKIYRPGRRCFEREQKALEFFSRGTNFKIPEVVKTGELEGFNYVLMTQIPGAAMTRKDWLTLPEGEQRMFVSELAAGLKQLHELDGDVIPCNWAEFVEDRADTFIERQIAHGVNSKIIKSLPGFIETNLPLVPKDCRTVFMHGDIHFGNMRIEKSGGIWKIAGLFDFADSRRGFHEYDFLAVGLLMIQGQAVIQREFFTAYGYRESQLDETFRKRLMMLTMLYETSDLRRYALRLAPEAVDFSLEELEERIWSFTA